MELQGTETQLGQGRWRPPGRCLGPVGRRLRHHHPTADSEERGTALARHSRSAEATGDHEIEASAMGGITPDLLRPGS